MNAIASLSWSEPRHGIRTARGVRSLRTANPTPAFWAEWRANKAALQAEGISCDKDDAGNWRVLHWMKPDDATAVRPVASVPETIQPPAEANPPQVASASGDEQRAAGGVVFQERPAVRAELDAIVAALTSGERRSGVVFWSKEQAEIFEWFYNASGNLVIQARAGTGKTTTIKKAFEFAPENDILYAVFNKKNQKEALTKIADSRVEIKTLHGLGFSYIKSVWRDAQPDDKVEYDRIIAVTGDVSDDVATALEKLVGFAKNLFINPTAADLEGLCEERDIYTDSEEEEAGGWKRSKLAATALKVLERAKQKDSANRISFNDMVWLPVACSWVRPRYDLVVIDEAQDMNLPQLMMAMKACRKGGRICVVGDDRQAIYRFRGAAQDGMSMMRTALNAKSLGLTTTYRCPKLVVAEAATIVPDYKAAPEAPEGEIIQTDEIQLLEQVQVGDAILSRANAPLMSKCLQLLKRGVAARIEGRDIGKQLVGMVRKLKARSVPDFLKRLQRWEDKQLGRLKGLKDADGKRANIRDQRETLEAVAEGCANVSEIESRILSLFQDSDEQAKPAVVLSSVHKAKGLEWDRVFLLNWTFSGRKPKTPADAQEERNIKYVAITRTKRQLFKVSEGGKPNTVTEQKDGTKTGSI